MQGRPAPDPRPRHDVRLARDDRRDELREQARVVLEVGVDHHHDLGAGAQRLRVAGLLVGAVTVVPVVDENLKSELARDLEGFVRASSTGERLTPSLTALY